MRDLTCLEVADSAPGFALDILEPEARSRVAAHLLRCEACRRTVTGMQESAAELLDTGGDGWDERGWPSDHDMTEIRPARRRFRMVVCMAAAAMLFVGTTFGPEISQAARTTQRPSVSAVLMAGDRAVGSVRFYGDRTATVAVQVERLPAGGTLSVVVTSRDGTSVKIGELHVDHGRAAWLGRYQAGTTPTELVLLDPTLHQIAAAALS